MASLSVAEQIAGVPFWWHSIAFGGMVTPGFVTEERQQQMLREMRLPSDLRGKTVLDIGAYDGFFSFEAERRGAKRVVALDHFVWQHDMAKAIAYWKDCSARGVVTKPEDTKQYFDPLNLPGKLAFNTAHRLLNSKVEAVVEDFMEMDLDTFGTFDIVLYLGVLYHIENPLAAMRRVAKVTKDLAIIETEAMGIDGLEDRALCEFFPGAELWNDHSNWWSPNKKSLDGLCRAAGFSRVELLAGEAIFFRPKRSLAWKLRKVVGHSLRELD